MSQKIGWTAWTRELGLENVVQLTEKILWVHAVAGSCLWLVGIFLSLSLVVVLLRVFQGQFNQHPDGQPDTKHLIQLQKPVLPVSGEASCNTSTRMRGAPRTHEELPPTHEELCPKRQRPVCVCVRVCAYVCAYVRVPACV